MVALQWASVPTGESIGTPDHSRVAMESGDMRWLNGPVSLCQGSSPVSCYSQSRHQSPQAFFVSGWSPGETLGNSNKISFFS